MNSDNIARFSRSIVSAIDHLHYQRGHEKVFLKLDALGAGGWSCVSPIQNHLLYDWSHAVEERVDYLIDYINKNVLDENLPSHAVVEEYINIETRSGDIPADYTVCGFVLNSIFYPTSINLCGTNAHGQYIDQWTAPGPSQLGDQPEDWTKMFEIYAKMVEIEAEPLGYRNGIYAGDLFITTDRQYKQRDWNIRRGGRSSPESLTIFGQSNYELKVNVTIQEDLGCDKLFDLYTNVSDRLTKAPLYAYPFSTAYCYVSKSATSSFFRFDLLLDPQHILDENGNQILRKDQRVAVKNVLESIVAEEIRFFINNDN